MSELVCELVSGANQPMSATECVSKESSTEPANEQAVRANKRADQQITQYSLRLFLSHSTHCVASWAFPAPFSAIFFFCASILAS